MKKSLSLFFALALPLTAQLRITEVMSDSGHADPRADGDWFEITNTGSTAVNLSGYSFDDESRDRNQAVSLPNITLPAGASIIVLDENMTDSNVFRSLWNIDDSVIILTTTQLGVLPGLSRNGDAVHLFFGTNTPDSFLFGAATKGFSFARLNNGQVVPGNLSSNGDLGAYESNDTNPDVGSPGISTNPQEPLAPVFVGPFATAAIAGTPINSSEFRVTSFDPNLNDLITLSLSGAPAWLGITSAENGIGSFTGLAPQTGGESITFQVTATDNTGRATSQDYQINLLASSSPIILNEYNAVDPAEFLGGGTATATDPNLGRIEGNGGAWVEFVVTEALDLRGWTLEIRSADRLRRLKFSNHPALASFPGGTILTLTESKQTSPTRFNRVSLFSLSGYTWTNIWMHDSILIEQQESVHPDSPAIGSNDTRFTWFNNENTVVYGPAGETIALRDTDNSGVGDELIGVGNTEVFKLQADPTTTATPLNINYDDGSTSTFGRPNQWNGNLSIQSFAPYVSPNNPPTFGPVAQTKAVRGGYQVSVNAPGSPVTVLAAPDFLTINTAGATIDFANNRLLTRDDVGTYEITLRADRGTGSNNLGYLVFELEVLNPSPTVILNEYNAVADDSYLNGGSLAIDGDGLPNAFDTKFQRILGNGGNWFEVAVVGNDRPGSVDLRNWSIDVGEIAASGKFVNRSTVSFNNVSSWSSIPHGTLLTFTERNSLGGGLDTNLNQNNQLSSKGYIWSNVFLGTPALVTVTNPQEFRINSSNSAFVIRDASGFVVFGPAGEGVAPLEGIGNTDVFELNNDPSSLVSPIDDTSTTTLGYDDGSSGSTFGSPNLFAPLGSDTDRAQDFTPFIPVPSAFNDFLAANGLAGAGPNADSDVDGFSNLDEYIFGGNPADANNFPLQQYDPETGTLAMNVRTSDPLYPVVAQQSTDLRNWGVTDLNVSNAASPLGADFVLRSVSYTGSEPTLFIRMATTPSP